MTGSPPDLVIATEIGATRGFLLGPATAWSPIFTRRVGEPVKWVQSTEKLLPYLTLMGIIAWRLFWRTHINRQAPEAPCTYISANHEWKALHTKIRRSAILPDTPPTVRQAVRWIAQLGGFLGRKGDGEPGITTIWRGWSRPTDIAEIYRLLNAGEDTSNR